jgi:putative spermidine/putrescine transport system ATP-binding protein
MAHLEMTRIRRSFGDVHAVHDVDLKVNKGEFVSLLGPSGSGKTTLLRIVAGFENPDSGVLLLDGKDITRMPPQRRSMGMVFQSYALFPNMTAAENVAFGLRVRHTAADVVRRRVAELLALVGLEREAGRLPNQLSGGQQQRIALARALAPNPQVLLLDEPLSALDARIRVELRMQIRRIQRELAITTLYVTHDQEEALAVSDRVVVFRAGNIEQIGTPRQVYEQPATPFVSEFVGTTNRLTARVEDVRAGIVRVAGQSVAVDLLPEGVRPGDVVELRVRPERISLMPMSESARGPLAGRIADVLFLGGHTLVNVRVGEESVWVDRAQLSSEHAVGAAVELYLPAVMLVSPAQDSDEVAAGEGA